MLEKIAKQNREKKGKKNTFGKSDHVRNLLEQ